MMYPYLTFDDGTEVMHSDIVEDGDVEKVLVHFEGPTEAGFDSIRCKLPSYTWTPWEGAHSSADIDFLEQFLRNNAHLIYKQQQQDSQTDTGRAAPHHICPA